MSERWQLMGVLVAMGAGWGLAVPLGKMAVSTGYRPFGLIFWEAVIVAVVLGSVCALRRRPLAVTRAALWRYLMIAGLSTAIPGWAYFASAVHLPAGVLSILMSTVPMIAFPIALLLGNDEFRLLRLGGLFCGMAAVILLIGPEASLPDPAVAAVIPLALIAPACYACEGNFVARWGRAGLDPIQMVTGAALVAAALVLPITLVTGQWIAPLPPYGVADGALVLASLAHAVVYSIYVWLVGRAGSVFSAQVSYLVTGFGVVWSIFLLQETYSAYIWAAFAMMMAGIFLVQPRPRMPLAPAAVMSEDAPNGEERTRK